MQKRFIFAVFTAILFLAGAWSSITCEMMCLPQVETGMCCPQQMQQMMGHCEHPDGSSLMAMHNCNHSQDHESTASARILTSMQGAAVYVSAESLPNNPQAVRLRDRAQAFLLNKPPNLPLRI
jgi:hypothetical protein